MQIIQAYNGAIAGTAAVWLLFLALIFVGGLACLRRCRRVLQAWPVVTIGAVGVLWLVHTLVVWYTIRQVLMFRSSIAIEMSAAQALSEEVLLTQGCSSLLLAGTGLLIVLTCVVAATTRPQSDPNTKKW
jgi:hypothetical protein